jgi:hypothetical protein
MYQSAEGVLLTNDAPKAFAMNQSAEGVLLTNDAPQAFCSERTTRRTRFANESRAEGVCDERSADGAARR